MQIKDVMHQPVRTCRPHTNLTTAAAIMWDADCGSVPILDEEEHVVGMITDRDICMATALKHRSPDDIAVAEVTSGKVFACRPEDALHTALKTMRQERVHRLPVLAEDGRIEGIVSTTDLVQEAVPRQGQKRPPLEARDIVQTLAKIRRPSLRAQEASE